MSKLKSTKKPNPNTKGKLIPVRVDAVEWARINANAKMFTDGNVSEWIRYAALNFKVGKADLAK